MSTSVQPRLTTCSPDPARDSPHRRPASPRDTPLPPTAGLGSQADARKEQGGEDEDGSVAAVMVAQMNRGEPPGRPLPGSAPPRGRCRREDENRASAATHGVETSRPRQPRRASADHRSGGTRTTYLRAERPRSSDESQDDAERRERIDPARVQVVLVDRERHHCAEADRGSCDQPCLG